MVIFNSHAAHHRHPLESPSPQSQTISRIDPAATTTLANPYHLAVSFGPEQPPNSPEAELRTSTSSSASSTGAADVLVHTPTLNPVRSIRKQDSFTDKARSILDAAIGTKNKPVYRYYTFLCYQIIGLQTNGSKTLSSKQPSI